MTPLRSLTRRSFLEVSAAAGGLVLGGCAALSGRPVVTRGRLRHAAIGIGGMGASDLAEIASHPEVDIVALCDVDATFLQDAAEKHPRARLFRDWRRCLDETDDFDSVHVTVPDHMHAPIALEALRRGKHVYCQKPLTRTVREARAVAAAAKRARTVTQMGIQNHSNSLLGSAKQLFDQGHTGRIYEVHVWTDRPAGWWPQAVERPEGEDPVPGTLEWDLWLGVAPARPYKEKLYHPFVWRGRKDFGTGAQGDMACHLMDLPVWCLELGSPVRLRSDGPAPNGESYPLWSEIHYEFPANRLSTRGPLLLTWHDGGKKAPRELLDQFGAGEVPANACLLVGESGTMLASPYDAPRLLPAEKFANVAVPEVAGVNHWHQWVDACRGIGRASAPFSYAAHLTEVALLGNVALHFPHETLEWDAWNVRFPRRPEADALLGPRYRKGWRRREIDSMAGAAS
jgi:predicted dehydrogenase